MVAAVTAMTGLSACVSSVNSPVSSKDLHAPAHLHQALVSPTPSATARQTATAPLTGLPVSPRIAARPAVALVVAGAHPVGLGSADLVFEEITQPMRHRYIAVFQSRQANRVGPITSTRPTDGMVLSVLHPLFGYNGGTAGFIDVLHASKVVDDGATTRRSLYRGHGGALDASTTAFLAHDRRHSVPPPEVYQYRGGLTGQRALATAGVRRVSQVRVSTPGGGTQTWRFNASTDRWDEVAGGPAVAVSNLIIQTVKYKQVYLDHKAGVTAGSARVIGDGRMLVVTGVAGTSDQGTDGLAAAGTWHKPGVAAQTNYLDAKDFPMSLQPGPTWVILAPRGTKVRTT